MKPPKNIVASPMAADMDEPVLALPFTRCLTKAQAAEYLGIGVTLLTELRVPAVKFGRRCVYDVVDLDRWLDEYKQRGRAGKELETWPVKQGSTGELIRASGGSQPSYQTANAYAKVLGLRTEKKLKRS